MPFTWRRAVEMESRMLLQPWFDAGGLAGSVVAGMTCTGRCESPKLQGCFRNTTPGAKS